MIAAVDGAKTIAAFAAAPSTHPIPNRRRALIASARLVTAVSSVPTTNPPCTAIVSQARVAVSRANSRAIAGAAAVAENHSVMPITSLRATTASIRRGLFKYSAHLGQWYRFRCLLEAERRELHRELVRRGAERLRRRRLRLADTNRDARVAANADRFVDRHAAEERHVHLFRELLAAALAENVALGLARWTDEVAHVFDEPHRGYVELVVHLHRALGVGERHALRRRHQDRARHGHALAQAERDVPGAWREIDDQVIDVGPRHFPEELLDHAVQHRSAPDHRRIVGRQEGHRDELDAVLIGGNDPATVGAELRGDAQHHRHVRTIDVAVDHRHARAGLAERDREIHRDRGLADAALARTHGDDVAHTGDRLFRHVADHRGADLGGHRDVDSRHTGHA